jgi:hypothetical protein
LQAAAAAAAAAVNILKLVGVDVVAACYGPFTA